MRSELYFRPTLSEAATITGGVAIGDSSTRLPALLTTHSEEVCPGDLFCALPGQKQDGNHFLPRALLRGAGMLLCSTPPAIRTVPVLLAEDAVAALHALALHYRKSIGVRVVAVTGSVGKTTAKEAIAATLSSRYRVFRTPGNQNSNLGAPLALLAMPSQTQVAVMELGISHPGEMAALSALTRPDAVLLTRVGHAHIGAFGTQAAILREKLEVLRHAAEGAPFLLPYENAAAAPPGARTFSVSAKEADYTLTHITEEEGRYTFTCLFHGEEIGRFTVQGYGYGALCAGLESVAMGHFLKLDTADIARGLLDYTPPPGRTDVRRHDGICWIDDSYNASPESMENAMALLHDLPGERRCALLGDMLELGQDAQEAHRAAGRAFARAGGELLLVFGRHALRYAEGAARSGVKPENIRILPANNPPERTAALVARLCRPGDIWLCKASHAGRLDDVLHCLEHPGNAPGEE